MILGLFYCILTFTLLGRKSVIAKNHVLFGVKLLCLKFGLCKGKDILKENKPAEQAAGRRRQTLLDATPPVGQIHTFSKWP